MLFLGLVLLFLGYIFGIGILVTLGWILSVIGLILLVATGTGHPVAGRKNWY